MGPDNGEVEHLSCAEHSLVARCRPEITRDKYGPRPRGRRRWKKSISECSQSGWTAKLLRGPTNGRERLGVICEGPDFAWRGAGSKAFPRHWVFIEKFGLWSGKDQVLGRFAVEWPRTISCTNFVEHTSDHDVEQLGAWIYESSCKSVACSVFLPPR